MTYSTPTHGTATARIHGLDTLRATALALGIVLHALMPFLPGIPWLFSDSRSSPIAHITVDWIHLFRMVLFMTLAGFFGRMVLHRRRAGPYVRDRLLRIGLPAIAFWPVAVASIGVVIGIGAALRGQAPEQAPEAATATTPDGVPEVLLLFSPAHLWFLWVLVECVLITVVLRAIALRLLGRERSGRIASRIGGLLAAPGGIVLAAIPYLACLLMQGTTVGGIREPYTILPSVTALTAYLGAFLVGWFLHAQAGSLHRIARGWPAQLAAAVVLAVAVQVLPAEQTPLLLHASLMALAGWTWTFALIGLCVRFLQRESRLMRYLADASYWSYLLHLPIVIAVGLALADLDWPILVKLAITFTVTAVLLLGSYDLFVRSTWIGKWLNGHRHPRALAPRRPTSAKASERVG
ncbi:acyltransferase family protein [Agromyces laixinhei]|uniref:acyltransferase family protein n=1 Tax=Agromyces laixinhei TaxID=2585717 RepID=UPI0011177450|nr:acyltransferase family protein [Agromyces laixinhei]